MALGGVQGKGKLPIQGKKPGLPGQKGPLRPQNPNDLTIEGNLKQLLETQGVEEEAPPQQENDPLLTGQEAPLVRLVNSLLIEAVKLNASDVHIEPFEGLLRVRFRIDGVLQEIQKIPHKLAASITSRLKIMADLDICEKRIPQDGVIKFRSGGVDADMRMSTLPSVFGEKVVMRVLGKTNLNNDLSKLGIPEEQLRIFRDAIGRPDGLVLVTGPTGSGKTTTLYAALNELNDISVSVFTAEDPVEGTLPGVTQCQVNPPVGYTFASILRSFLRQDPDVILVGEIRDQETAEISIKASLTGHLVLSTLHTNCAVSTISRLINMGVAPYLIASSVNCVVAQRLVRRVCVDCKQQKPLPDEILQTLGPAAETLRGIAVSQGKGCPKCHGSGYKGRAPLYEILAMSDEIRKMVLAEASTADLRTMARRQGMVSLREAGLELVKSGVTSLEEVLGVTNEEGPPATQVHTQAYVMPAPTVMSAPPNAHSAHPMTAPLVTATPQAAPVTASPQTVASAAVDGKERDMIMKWKSQRMVKPGEGEPT